MAGRLSTTAMARVGNTSASAPNTISRLRPHMSARAPTMGATRAVARVDMVTVSPTSAGLASK